MTILYNKEGIAVDVPEEAVSDALKNGYTREITPLSVVIKNYDPNVAQTETPVEIQGSLKQVEFILKNNTSSSINVRYGDLGNEKVIPGGVPAKSKLRLTAFTGINQLLDLPTATIESSDRDGFLEVGKAITFTATQVNPGIISKIEFYANSNLIGTVTAQPYIQNYSFTATGTYQVYARVYSGGDYTTTDSIQFFVTPNRRLILSDNSSVVAPSTPSLNSLINDLLPVATNKTKIARAATLTASFFNFDSNLTAENVVTLLGKVSHWYSFNPKDVLKADNSQGQIDQAFSFVKDQKTGLLITSNQVASRTNPIIRDNGAYCNANNGFSFNGSKLANQPLSVVVLGRPITLNENYLSNSCFIGGNSNVDLEYLQLGYFPGDVGTNPTINTGDPLLGSNVIYNNGILQSPIKLKVSSSIELTANTTLPISYITHRFLTVNLTANGIKLYENDTKVAETLTQTFLTSYTNGRIGDARNGAFPMKGVIYEVLFFAPGLTESELRIIRVFLNFYRNQRIYKINEDIFDGFRFKQLSYGNKIAGTRQWDDYSKPAPADVDVHPAGAAIGGIAVTSDGTVFVSSFYEESARKVAVLKDGKIIGSRSAGVYGLPGIALNSTHLFYTYVTRTDPNVFYKIQRAKRTITNDVYFVNPFDPNPDALTSEITVNQQLFATVSTGSDNNIDFSNAIKGLAVSETEIFVSDPLANQIKVYTIANSTLVRNWTPTTAAGKLLLDPNGTSIWCCQIDRVVQYDLSGAVLKTVNLITNPTAICFNSSGILLIADANQNITLVDVSGTPTQTGTFGNGSIFAPARGANIGVYSTGYFFNISDIKCDNSGNIYIADSVPGSSALNVLKLSDGSLVWNSFASLFLEAGYFDPDDENILYSGYFKFKVEALKGKWERVANHANFIKYPNDPRKNNPGIRNGIVKLAGRKFLVNTNFTEEILTFYRFNSATDGEVAIPCAKINFVNDTAWFDYDGDSVEDAGEIISFTPPEHLLLNGAWVDDFGNVIAINSEARLPNYDMYLLKYNFLGLNQFGCPIWDLLNPIKITIPNSSNYTAVTRWSLNKEANLMILTFVSTEVVRNNFSCGNIVGIYYYDRIANTITTFSVFPIYYSQTDNRIANNAKIIGNKVLVGYRQNRFYEDETYPLFRFYDFKGTELDKFGYLPQETNGDWMDFQHPFNVIESSNGQILISSEDVAFGRNMFTIVEYKQTLSFPAFNPANQGFSNWWTTRRTIKNQTNGALLIPDQINSSDLKAPSIAGSPAITTGLKDFKSLTFDGVNDYLKTDTYSLAQPLTIFLVLKVLPGNNDESALFDGGTAVTMLFDVLPGSNRFRQHAGFGQTSGAVLDNNWIILSCIYNGASSSTRKNGTQIIAADVSNNVPNGFTLGARGNNFFNGKLEWHEAFIAPNVVSTDNQNFIGRYLSKIYGLTWNSI